MAARTSMVPRNTVRASPNVFRGRLLVDLPPYTTPVFTGTHDRFERPEGAVEHALWIHPRAGRMHTERGLSRDGTIEWWTHVVEPRRHTSMPAFSMGYTKVDRDRDAWVNLGHGGERTPGSLLALARLLVVSQLEPVSFADDFDVPQIHLWPRSVRHLDQWSTYAQVLYRAYWDALESATHQRGVVVDTHVPIPDPVQRAHSALFGTRAQEHASMWWGAR